MTSTTHADPELAAALFYLLGEPVPHDPKLERTAGEIRNSINNKEKLLLKIIELCGNSSEPRELYLCEKAYSWLGKKYCRQTIQYAKRYLESAGWDALSGRTEKNEGIVIDYGDARRAGVFIDLAKALEETGNLEEAYSNYLHAYDLEPYNAMVVIKAAEVLLRSRGREEALNFLFQQRHSLYYDPIKYRDSAGKIHRNEVFKDLLEAHIRKLQGKSTEE
jgi:tetratricopeptide (TPR) repeat protein